MMPPLRPLQPLLQIATPPWSRPRPKYAFHVQRYLFHGTKSEDEGFPHIGPSQRLLKREELLNRLSFPRKYVPTRIHSRLWWTMKRTPLLLTKLVGHGVRYQFWRMQHPRPPKEKDVVVKSRIGRFFYDFVTQSECHSLLNTTMQPWGYFHTNHGKSMQPTFSGNSAISYTSYAYVESQDVSLGDVVTVLGPKYDNGTKFLCNRVAGLEGDRIWVTTGQYKTQEIIRLPPKKCFVLGDNPTESGDSRQFGALPIEAVWGKVRWRWGLDGFHWISHDRRPWLENKVIEHLAPGQNRPSHGGPLVKQPEKKQKKPIVILRPKVMTPPPLSVPKKKRKDPRKKS